MTILFPIVLGPKPHLHPGLKIRNRIRAPMATTSEQNATSTNILASVQFKSVFESNFRDFRKPIMKRPKNGNYITISNDDIDWIIMKKPRNENYLTTNNDDKEWIKLNVGGIKISIFFNKLK